jgi:hypothetical protein
MPWEWSQVLHSFIAIVKTTECTWREIRHEAWVRRRRRDPVIPLVRARERRAKVNKCKT